MQFSALILVFIFISIPFTKFSTHPFQIFDCTQYTSNTLMVLGTGLEFTRWITRSRADFISLKLIHQLILAIQHAYMRSKELIS